jgi:hypothetical protein
MTAIGRPSSGTSDSRSHASLDGNARALGTWPWRYSKGSRTSSTRYEHVRSDPPRRVAQPARRGQALRPRAFGGCHTARDTPAAIAAAGCDVEESARCGSTRCRSPSRSPPTRWAARAGTDFRHPPSRRGRVVGTSPPRCRSRMARLVGRSALRWQLLVRFGDVRSCRRRRRAKPWIHDHAVMAPPHGPAHDQGTEVSTRPARPRPAAQDPQIRPADTRNLSRPLTIRSTFAG